MARQLATGSAGSSGKWVVLPVAVILAVAVWAAAGTGSRLVAGAPGIFGTPLADGKSPFAHDEYWGGGYESTSSVRPSPRGYHAMTYDAESDRLILFGGQSNTASGLPDLSDTWGFDLGLAAWTNQMPAPSPPAGALTMVYHAPSDRAVILKGNPTTGHLDAWGYDYNSNSWAVQASPDAPAGRNGWRIAYDAQSDRIILFGGILNGVRQNDTWAFDYSNNTWTEMTPIVSPPARNWHRMVYDARGDRIVLFGGSVEDNRTWAYDYESNTWSSLGSAGAPPPRIYHDMVYDAQTDRIILFGGVDYPSEVPHNDTWTYDLGTRVWTKLATSMAPSARGWHAMALADRSREIVLFGGGPDRTHFTQETWSYDVDTNEWIHTDVATRPSARAGHSMAYDTGSDRIILFGGHEHTPSGSVTFDGQTWAYDRNINRWTNMAPTASPSPRAASAIGYDEQSDRIILFGGVRDGVPNGETWAYNWNANEWVNMQPAVSPPARYGARMAYDSRADRIILFGGHDGTQFADTWSYDLESNTWAAMAPSGGPSARAFHSMAYDVESARIVLFGGQFFNGASLVYYNDTWTYDVGANTWAKMSPPSSPPPHSGHAASYDSRFDRVLVFGGDPGGRDTWAYDVNTDRWMRIEAPSSPSDRAIFGMAYDAESDCTVIFGGIWPWGSITDPALMRNRETWVFTSENNTWTMTDGPKGPAASYEFSPSSPSVGDSVTFDASASTDPDGTVVLYEWDFSDGGSALGPIVQHVFENVGAHAVRLTVTDDDGLSQTVTNAVNVVPETVPPSIAIASPATGAVLNSSSVTVTGTASDNRAIRTIELSADGANWALATGTTSWSGTLTLPEGPNTLRARATDTSGNAATASRDVVVDTTKPTVTIASPTEGAAFDSLTVTVSGTASDNWALEMVELSTDALTWTPAAGTTSWSGTLTLKEGENTVYVRATDQAGNLATNSVTVTVRPPGPSSLLIVSAIGGVVAAGAAGIALLLRRRRRAS